MINIIISKNILNNMRRLIMPQVKIEKGPDVKPELFQKYKQILPDELMEIWREYGFASILNGYMKFINPDEYQQFLKDTYFRGNISVPILVTAFGDIITFEQGKYIGIVKYKERDFDLITKRFESFMRYIEEESFCNENFELPKYAKALEKLGRLEYDECYGYIPLLSESGRRRWGVNNLRKVKICEHVVLMSQLIGKVGIYS